MGGLSSKLTQVFPPPPLFQPETDIPDLTGKVAIVTGGNTGIGFHTVEELLKKNAKVYMASRSESRANVAIRKLKELTGKEAIFLPLDLADLASVAKASKEFKRNEHELHMLFNSAGVMAPPVKELTVNGYDLQFGTNVLGHALFTLCLIPELVAGAKSSLDGKARVINTSSASVSMAPKGGIAWDSLENNDARLKIGTLYLYGQSKVGNVLFSSELARRYADQGIISNALNPGNIRTELQRHFHPVVDRILGLILYPAPYGAITQLWAGTSPETKDFNGKFFIPWGRVGDPGPDAKNPETAEKLWNWIEEQRRRSGLFEPLLNSDP